MSKGFNLTAQINLQGPSNIRQVVSDIRRQLGTINANVNINIGNNATRNVASLNTRLNALNSTLNATVASANNAATAFNNLSTAMASVGNVRLPNNITASVNNTTASVTNASRAVAQTRTEFEDFGRQAGLAVRRFSAFASVTSVIYGLNNALAAGIKQYIEFDRQITRLSQVTNVSKNSLSDVASEITRLSTSMGVASNDLASVSVTLAQAGFSAKDTKIALEALAKTTLAPSFDNLNQTVEGSIALMRQFGISANNLESALGSVNAVAAGFAVESSDLIAAIQRTGGVFASASKGVSEGTDALNEFLALFTSIRATTRESAETIATGLRTIFTRIQRADTVEALKEFGVVLTDLEGKFVGPFEAVRRLSEGLGRLDPRDLKFSQIVEELGGFRQIGKVLPLIQQFTTAQEALKVAQQGQGSLALDAVSGQQALAVQIQKVREEFSALMRSFGQSDSFQTLVKLGLDLASALIKVADATKGLLPLIGIMAAFRGVSAITQFAGGFGSGLRGGNARRASMGGVIGFAKGGSVPGVGNSDSVPAMLTPGEFVMSKAGVARAGRKNLETMNSGGRIQRFAKAGKVEDTESPAPFVIPDPYTEKLVAAHVFQGKKLTAARAKKVPLPPRSKYREQLVKKGKQEKTLKAVPDVTLYIPEGANNAAREGGEGIDKKSFIDWILSNSRALLGESLRERQTRRSSSLGEKDLISGMTPDDFARAFAVQLDSNQGVIRDEHLETAFKATAGSFFKSQVLEKKLKSVQVTAPGSFSQLTLTDEQKEQLKSMGDDDFKTYIEQQAGTIQQDSIEDYYLKQNILDRTTYQGLLIRGGAAAGVRLKSTRQKLGLEELSLYKGGKIQNFKKGGKVFEIGDRVVTKDYDTSGDFFSEFRSMPRRGRRLEMGPDMPNWAVPGDYVESTDRTSEGNTYDILYGKIIDKFIDDKKQTVYTVLDDETGKSFSSTAANLDLASSYADWGTPVKPSSRGSLKLEPDIKQTDQESLFYPAKLAYDKVKSFFGIETDQEKLGIRTDAALRTLHYEDNPVADYVDGHLRWAFKPSMSPMSTIGRGSRNQQEREDLGLAKTESEQKATWASVIRMAQETLESSHGGKVKNFVDGGWVTRMQRYSDKELNEEMMYLYSLLDLYDLGEGPFPARTFSGKKKEDIGKREARQRIKAIDDYIATRKEMEKQKFANRKGPGLKPTEQYDTQEMLDAITYYQAGSGPFTKALVAGKKTFTDPRGETYQTQDIRDRLLAASQFKIPKKTYSGLGKSQLKEILSDTKITPKQLLSKPSENLKRLVGKTVDFPTFLSVSADQSQAEPFVQNPGALLSIDGSSSVQKTIDIIKAKNKTAQATSETQSKRLPGLEKISEKKLEAYDEEKEFIIPPGVGFKITRASGTVSSSFAKDLKSKKSGGVGSTGGLSLASLYDSYFGEDDKEFEKTRLDLAAKMLRSGGLIQRFKEGGVAKRNVGYIDYDVIANPANEAVVSKGMESTGVKGPRLYTDHLTQLAVKARKDKSLGKLRAIYGVAGAGKTTLARGQGTDKGKLRETTRFPILTPEDIQRASEVIVLSSTVSQDKLDDVFSATDRTYTLSSTTKAEKEKVKSQRVDRDITGVGQEGRKPGSTLSVATDTAVGEALLSDRLGDRSVVLGRSSSGKVRRKRGDELVEVIKKKIGFTWGGYSPMTAGHESIMDAAAAMGIPPEDFIYLVGSNEGIIPGKEDSYRTAIFDQDTRMILAQAGAGAKGATVLRKPRDFEVPQAFDISEPEQRRRVIVPAKGSTTFVADKTPEETEKYKKAGYKVQHIERTGGISGTMVRKLIQDGNLAELQKVLSPGVYELISNNIGRIQNRANIIPSLIQETQQTQGVKLADIEKQIKAVGITKIVKSKLDDPEYAAKAEVLTQLREKRDQIKSAAAFEPHRLLAALAAKEPEKYGLDLGMSSIVDPKPIRTISSKQPQKASIGGLIQNFMSGSPGGVSAKDATQSLIASGALSAVKTKPFARKLLGSMQRKVIGNLDDKTFDFDGTLVDHAEVLDDKGKIDILGHTDISRVEEALTRAKLTPLGKQLVQKTQTDPDLLSKIKLLTARPQSNAPAIADKLGQLGLPITSGQIKGVSSGSFSDDIPTLKSGALDQDRTLLDDNLDNVSKVIEDGKKAVLYRDVKNLDPDYASYLATQYLGQNQKSRFIGDIPQLLLQQSEIEAAEQMGLLKTSYAEMVRSLEDAGMKVIVPKTYNGKSTGRWSGRLDPNQAGKVLRSFTDPKSLPNDLADRQTVKEYVMDQYQKLKGTRKDELQEKTSTILGEKYEQVSKVTDPFVIFGFEPVGHKRLDILEPWDLGKDKKGKNKIINPLVYEAGLPQKSEKKLEAFRKAEDRNIAKLATRLSKKKKEDLTPIDDKTKERLGQGNIEGGALEKLAVQLGSTPYKIPDQLTETFKQNRPVDFSSISSDMFKIWDIPTIFQKTNTLYEAKRTIDSDSRTKAYEEFKNASRIKYGIKPPEPPEDPKKKTTKDKKTEVKKNLGGLIQQFNGGGLVQNFKDAGEVEAKQIGMGLGKGRGKEGARGARSPIEPISSETYLKWAQGIYAEYDKDPSLVWTKDELGISMPPEIAFANRLLTQYSLETGGAGLSLGKRFVTTPEEYIDDDLRPYLIPDPNDPNKLGFYEDVVGKFARAKKLSAAASKKMGKTEALKAAEARLGSYASAESSISSFKKSGVLDISGSIRDYLISSIRNPDSLPLDSDEIESIKKKLTKTNLDAFEGLVGPEKIPVGVQGQRTKLSEVFGTILETYDSDVSDLEVDNITRAMGEKLSLGGYAQRFMSGGAVKSKTPKLSFGTGAYPFPKRISNSYFKDMEKILDHIKVERVFEAYPKDERIIVDEASVSRNTESFNLELFKKSFSEKISRNGLFSQMGQFARFIGLPQEDLASFLPTQIDFVKPQGFASGASFSKDPSGPNTRGLDGVDLSAFGFTEADKQDAYGYSKLIEEKKKEVEKVLKTPVKTIGADGVEKEYFDDGSFHYDETKARALWDEINDLKQRYSEKLKLNNDAIKQAKESRKASAEASGRGSVNIFQNPLDRYRRAKYDFLYHEMTHQLFETLRKKQADSFVKYKERVNLLFEGDNNDLVDAFDSLGGGYTSADVVYGRSYKLAPLDSISANATRKHLDSVTTFGPKPTEDDKEALQKLRDTTSKARVYKRATEFKPLNPDVNSLLLNNGYSQAVLDRMEDNGKEEFLTTLVEKLPVLDSNLENVLNGTLDSLFSDSGMSRRPFVQGGLADSTEQMQGLMRGLYGNRKSIEEPVKKEKNFGKISLLDYDDMINASYSKNDVGLSKATSGYGPRLYDVVMEAVSEKGAMLTSDRSSVSGDAKKVWEYYFKNRGDVKKTPLEPEDWTKNQSLIDPKLYGRRETWPPPTDSAWVLQSGYSKSPSLINDPNSVVRSKKKLPKSTGQMALQYFGRANGGAIGFADGGTVPALVSNGEAYVPPKVAQRIGYGTLNRMNQADKNGMGRFSKGGISVFKGPGTGTSDSIPTSLPVGSFIIRAKATKALGLNKGGSVGVQRFLFGGSPAARPASPTLQSVGIDSSILSFIEELSAALQKMGLTASQTSAILQSKNQQTYDQTIKAIEADVRRVKISGASADQIRAAEEALKEVRDRATRDINTRKQLSGATGEQLQQIDSQVDEKAQKLEEAQVRRLQARNPGMTTAEATETVAKDRQKYRDLAYQSTARDAGLNVTGLKGQDIQRFVSQMMRDRKTLQQMDKELIRIRQEEVKARTEYTIATKSEQKKMLNEAKQAAEEEIKQRKSFIDQKAASEGASSSSSEDRRDQQSDTFRNIALIGAAQMVGQMSIFKSSSSGAAFGGATAGAAEAIGYTRQITQELAGLGTVCKSLSKVFGSLTVQVAIAVIGAFKEAYNAMRQFNIELEKNKAEKIIATLASQFEKLSENIQNIDLQKDIANNIARASETIDKQQRLTFDTPEAQFTNLAEILNLSVAQPLAQYFDRDNPAMVSAARNRTIEASLRSQVLASEGIMEYFRVLNSKEALLSKIPEYSQKQALEISASYKGLADNINQLIEARIKTGSSVQDVQEGPDFERFAKTLVYADAVLLANIRSIELDTSISEEARKARVQEIIAIEGASKIRTRAEIASRQLQQNLLKDTVGVYTRSLQRSFNNMEQSINKTSLSLERMKNDVDLLTAAFQGQAKIGNTIVSAINTIQNPNAYSSNQVDSALGTAGSFFGNKSREMAQLAGLGETITSSVMSTINRTFEEKGPSVTNETLTRVINQNLRETLRNLGLPPELSDKLAKEIGDSIVDIRKENDTRVDYAKLSEKVANLGSVVDTAKNAQQIAIKALENYQNILNQYSTNNNSIIDLEISAREKSRKSISLVIEANRALAKALGKTSRVADEFSKRNAEVARRTGGATDPQDIFDNIIKLNNTRASQESAKNRAANRGLTGVDDFVKISNELRRTSVALRENRAALEDMANNTTKASAAMEAIQEAQQRAAGRVSFLEKVVTATPDEFESLDRALYRLQNNMNGQVNIIQNSVGAQKAFNEAIQNGSSYFDAMRAAQTAFANERKETLGALQDIMPFLGDNEQANTIKANVLETMAREAGIGISPVMQQILDSLRNPQQDPATAAAIGYYNDAISEQRKATDLLGSLDSKLANDIATKNSKLISQELFRTAIQFTNSELKDLNSKVNTVVTILQKPNNPAPPAPAGAPIAPPAVGAAPISTGGIVYASTGTLVNFQPKGTDTVPAMLTPGEFVVNRAATQRNLPLLQSINNNSYSNGGKVGYYNNGGLVLNSYSSNRADETDQVKYNIDILDPDSPLNQAAFAKAKNRKIKSLPHSMFTIPESPYVIPEESSLNLDKPSLKSGSVHVGYYPSIKKGRKTTYIDDIGDEQTLEISHEYEFNRANIAPKQQGGEDLKTADRLYFDQNLATIEGTKGNLTRKNFKQIKDSLNKYKKDIEKPTTRLSLDSLPDNGQLLEQGAQSITFTGAATNRPFLAQEIYDSGSAIRYTEERPDVTKLPVPMIYHARGWYDLFSGGSIVAPNIGNTSYLDDAAGLSDGYYKGYTGKTRWAKEVSSVKALVGPNINDLVNLPGIIDQNKAKDLNSINTEVQKVLDNTKLFINNAGIDPAFDHQYATMQNLALHDQLKELYYNKRSFLSVTKGDPNPGLSAFDQLTDATSLVLAQNTDTNRKSFTNAYEASGPTSKVKFDIPNLVLDPNRSVPPFHLSVDDQPYKSFLSMVNGDMSLLGAGFEKDQIEQMKKNLEKDIQTKTITTMVKTNLRKLGAIDLPINYTQYTGKFWNPEKKEFFGNQFTIGLPEPDANTLFEKLDISQFRLFTNRPYTGNDISNRLKFNGNLNNEIGKLDQARLNNDNNFGKIRKNIADNLNLAFNGESLIKSKSGVDGLELFTGPAIGGIDKVNVGDLLLNKYLDQMKATAGEAEKVANPNIRDKKFDDEKQAQDTTLSFIDGALKVFSRSAGTAGSYLYNLGGRKAKIMTKIGGYDKRGRWRGNYKDAANLMSQALNFMGGQVDKMIPQSRSIPQRDSLLRTRTLLYGAHRVFDDISKNRVQMIKMALSSGLSIEDIFSSYGLTRFALSEDFKKAKLDDQWLDLFENNEDLSKVKIAKVGRAGRLDFTNFDEIRNEEPTTSDLIPLIFNPYNEFPNRDFRKSLISKFANDLKRFRNSQGLPYFDKPTQAFIQQNLSNLYDWYGGIGDWVGQDYFFDERLQPGDRIPTFLSSFIRSSRYNIANKSHALLGFLDSYGSLPDYRWFQARANKLGQDNLEQQDPANVVGLNKGGVVYASTGTLVPYQPRGTDTVPAMLTPGEFVVNRAATQRNLPLLKSINSGNYSDGGVVYLANGGKAERLAQIDQEANIAQQQGNLIPSGKLYIVVSEDGKKSSAMSKAQAVFLLRKQKRESLRSSELKKQFGDQQGLPLELLSKGRDIAIRAGWSIDEENKNIRDQTWGHERELSEQERIAFNAYVEYEKEKDRKIKIAESKKRREDRAQKDKLEMESRLNESLQKFIEERDMREKAVALPPTPKATSTKTTSDDKPQPKPVDFWGNPVPSQEEFDKRRQERQKAEETRRALLLKEEQKRIAIIAKQNNLFVDPITGKLQGIDLTQLRDAQNFKQTYGDTTFTKDGQPLYDKSDLRSKSSQELKDLEKAIAYAIQRAKDLKTQRLSETEDRYNELKAKANILKGSEALEYAKLARERGIPAKDLPGASYRTDQIIREEAIEAQIGLSPSNSLIRRRAVDKKELKEFEERNVTSITAGGILAAGIRQAAGYADMSDEAVLNWGSFSFDMGTTTSSTGGRKLTTPGFATMFDLVTDVTNFAPGLPAGAGRAAKGLSKAAQATRKSRTGIGALLRDAERLDTAMMTRPDRIAQSRIKAEAARAARQRSAETVARQRSAEAAQREATEIYNMPDYDFVAGRSVPTSRRAGLAMEIPPNAPSEEAIANPIIRSNEVAANAEQQAATRLANRRLNAGLDPNPSTTPSQSILDLVGGERAFDTPGVRAADAAERAAVVAPGAKVREQAVQEVSKSRFNPQEYATRQQLTDEATRRQMSGISGPTVREQAVLESVARNQPATPSQVSATQRTTVSEQQITEDRVRARLVPPEPIHSTIPLHSMNPPVKPAADQIAKLYQIRAESVIPELLEKLKELNIQRFNKGGMVYASTGTLVPYQPRGTDTVPAMLTPGEFVVNRNATQKNLPLLQSINSNNYQNGGQVKYLMRGGVGGSFFMSRTEKEAYADQQSRRREEYKQRKETRAQAWADRGIETQQPAQSAQAPQQNGPSGMIGAAVQAAFDPRNAGDTNKQLATFGILLTGTNQALTQFGTVLTQLTQLMGGAGNGGVNNQGGQNNNGGGFAGLAAFTQKFENLTNQLAALNIPPEININLVQNEPWNININGAEVLAAIDPKIREIVQQAVEGFVNESKTRNEGADPFRAGQ